MNPINTTQANQQFRDSLIRDASQSKRLAITFECHRSMFLDATNRTKVGLHRFPVRKIAW
jgi:hypothetical protein